MHEGPLTKSGRVFMMMLRYTAALPPKGQEAFVAGSPYEAPQQS